MAKKHRRVLDFLEKVTAQSDADLEAIRAMSGEELDAELAEAGIDAAQFHQRIQKLVRTQGQPTVSLAAGIEWVLWGLKSFMRVTLEGLEDLHRAYVPSLMRSKDMELRGALEQAKVPVVVLSLNPAEDGVKLAARWLGRIPESPPTVSVTLEGKPAHAPSYEWLDWDGQLERTQGLLIHECPLEPQRLQAAAGPVLAYEWEAEESHLHIDLLPPPDDE